MGAVLGAALVYATSEWHRGRERLARAERRLAELARERAELTAEALHLRDEVARLQLAAADAIELRDSIGEVLHVARREVEDLRQREHERLRAVARPMPEGVRLALVALNELLRADGHAGARFLSARSIDAHELEGVELIDADPKSLTTTVYLARRATLELDRATAAVVARLEGGQMLRAGAAEPLPEDGLAITFAGVNGSEWERRLPHLVRPVGEYAEVIPATAPPPLDPVTERGWQERVANLLDRAGTELTWDLARFRGLAEGRFANVLLLGYDAGRRLAASAEARSLEVVVDRAADAVFVELRDGILRTAGGDTTIPQNGYRILLPELRPDQAIDVMMGMVRQR